MSRRRLALPYGCRALSLFALVFLLVFLLFARIPVRLAQERPGTSSSNPAAFSPLRVKLTPAQMASLAMGNATEGPGMLKASLAERKQKLLQRLEQPAPANAEKAVPIVIIMGNEAGDTDSMASAMLLAELLSAGQSSAARKFPDGSVFVPLMQLPRQDLSLRAENEYLLQRAQLEASDLLFLDELPPLSKMQRPDILLGLVDHPQLSGYWQPADDFGKRVEIVVDHHADVGAHKHARIRTLMGPENGAIGSAVSVVMSIFQGTTALKSISPPLADLGLAALLIDTNDLRPVPSGKAQDQDLIAANILLERSSLTAAQGQQMVYLVAEELDVKDNAGARDDLQAQEGTAVASIPFAVRYAATNFFQVLSQKKLDVSRLDGHGLLRRDYKEETLSSQDAAGGKQLRAGFSSVPVGLSEWIHQRHGDDDERWDGFFKVLRAWMKERSLDIAVVGTSFRERELDSDGKETGDGKHRRELVLTCLQPANSGRQIYDGLIRHLETNAYSMSHGNDGSLRLDLEQPWKGSYRVPSTGKRERVGMLDGQGRWAHLNEPGFDMYVSVWRQRNARASRKVYLPAVMHALKTALAAGSKGKA